MPGLTIYNEEDMVAASSAPYFSCYGERFGNFATDGEDFSHGVFDHGDFFSITFENCDFSSASFEKASLRNICFIDCDFSNASFDGAEIEECSFLNSGLSGCGFPTATLVNITISDCYGQTDFGDAEISGGVFHETNLAHSSFYGTEVDGTVFSSCNLTDILMSHATAYKDVTMVGCDITDVYFVMADGGSDIVYNDCIYKPYVEPAKKPKRQATASPISPKLKVYNNHSSSYVSYGWNASAKLYCSSMEEYGQTG